MKIYDLDSMLGSALSEVSLTPYDETGIIPILGDHTPSTAKELYDCYCRCDIKEGNPPPGTFEQMKKAVYKYLDHVLKLGALAAHVQKDGGDVYDLATAIALIPIAYAKIKGNKIIAVDSDGSQLERARFLINLFGVGNLVELVEDNVENRIDSSNLKPKDILIFSEVNDELSSYWQNLLKRKKATLIINQGMNFRDAFGNLCWYEGDRLEKGLTRYIERHFKQYGYTVDVAQSKFSPQQMVFIAVPS